MINVLEAVKDFELKQEKLLKLSIQEFYCRWILIKFLLLLRKQAEYWLQLKLRKRKHGTTDFCNYFRKLLLRSQEALYKRISGKNGISPFGVSGELYLYPRMHEYICCA
jgi:hypothetical protein